MPSSSPHFHHLILLLSITLFLLLISPARSHDPNQPQQQEEREQDNICPSLSGASRSLSDSGSGSGSSSCNINCFRPNPVCGVNGVTYWCGCPEAACAGVQVAKRGFCQVGNGSSSTISGQAFLLLHIVWLILLGFSVLCGFL